MKRLFIIILTCCFSILNARTVELVVKYKQNKNMQLQSINQSNEAFDRTTDIVKVDVPDNTSFKLSQKNNYNNAEIEDYKAAREFMENHPDVIYAIPKNSKVHAFNLKNNVSDTTKYYEWSKQWDLMSSPNGMYADNAWHIVKDNFVESNSPNKKLLLQ